jgi:hypothetical protein
VSFKGAKQAVTAFAPKIEAARPKDRPALINAMLSLAARVLLAEWGRHMAIQVISPDTGYAVDLIYSLSPAVGTMPVRVVHFPQFHVFCLP